MIYKENPPKSRDSKRRHLRQGANGNRAVRAHTMGRKKRSRHSPPPPLPPPVPCEEPFHTPFQQLKEQLRQVVPAAAPVAVALPASPSPARPLSSLPVTAEQQGMPLSPGGPKTSSSPGLQIRQENTIFLQAMAEVMPLPTDPRGRVEKPRPVPIYAPPPLAEAPDELSELRDLVEGRGAFTLQYTDEYMEGVAPGVDVRLAQRLHRGDYAVQAHYDLHGHTVEEAHLAVTQFLTRSYATGRRCILLIHGRGRNSKDNRPVLKEQVQIWLSHGRLSRMVLAFATAPATDGGAGAVCVLLRRAPHVRKKS